MNMNMDIICPRGTEQQAGSCNKIKRETQGSESRDTRCLFSSFPSLPGSPALPLSAFLLLYSPADGAMSPDNLVTGGGGWDLTRLLLGVCPGPDKGFQWPPSAHPVYTFLAGPPWELIVQSLS